MLVCHCRVVNDQRIRQAIAEGARDEDALARACGAGAQCGGCLPAVSRLLDECLECPSEMRGTYPSPAASAEATITAVA